MITPGRAVQGTFTPHRKTKETKTTETKKWLSETLGDRPRYLLLNQQKPDEMAMKTSKRLAVHTSDAILQTKTGHTVVDTYLKRTNIIDDNRCWWCNNGERQTVQHLFKACSKWR
jgi:hypothetical protein